MTSTVNTKQGSGKKVNTYIPWTIDMIEQLCNFQAVTAFAFVTNNMALIEHGCRLGRHAGTSHIETICFGSC
eukprot:5874463-Amphidinium_carterae.1